MNDPLQTYLADTLAKIDGALACLVTDLTTREILAVAHRVPYFSEPLLEAVVAAAVNMFRGKNTIAVENLLSAQSGEHIARMFHKPSPSVWDDRPAFKIVSSQFQNAPANKGGGPD